LCKGCGPSGPDLEVLDRAHRKADGRVVGLRDGTGSFAVRVIIIIIIIIIIVVVVVVIVIMV
jgi:hypothetical protein